MSQSVSLPALKGFLPLTPNLPKESSATSSPPSSRPGSLSGTSNESLPPPSLREHRGSASSYSSASSDFGENGFLLLTPHRRSQDAYSLNKIAEDEAVE